MFKENCFIGNRNRICSLAKSDFRATTGWATGCPRRPRSPVLPPPTAARRATPTTMGRASIPSSTAASLPGRAAPAAQATPMPSPMTGDEHRPRQPDPLPGDRRTPSTSTTSRGGQAAAMMGRESPPPTGNAGSIVGFTAAAPRETAVMIPSAFDTSPNPDGGLYKQGHLPTVPAGCCRRAGSARAGEAPSARRRC